METRHGSYIPALGFRFLTPLYDPILRLTLREDEFKQRLIEEAGIEPGHTVLDLGCGTGTLLRMLKEACPGAQVTGVDGDPDVLAIARTKLEAAGVTAELRQGLAFELPFANGAFNRVLSSLVLHHLTTADKERALAEVVRVLAPSGECHIADWGRPHNALMQVASLGIRLLDGQDTTRANLEGRLPELMRRAGLKGVKEVHRGMTLFGTLSLYRGTHPKGQA